MPVLDLVDLVFSVLDIGGLSKRVLGAGKVRRWFWKQISQSWPIGPATVLSSHIHESPNGYYILSARYSFYAAGNRYGGKYEREFTEEWKAEEALQRLLVSTPVVRYRPSNPDTSVLDVP